MRKGLGKGLGMGYKNIAPMDSHVHSLSAMGVKSQKQYYDLSPRYDARASFYGKARVEESFGTLKLFSYNTLVAEIDEDGKAKVYGYYSPTTLRHVKEFLKQNGFKAESKDQIMKDYGAESLNAKGWKKFEQTPKDDGDFQNFLSYKKGRLEFEVVRYYDEDKGKYDNFYTVFRQIENKEGDSWDGDEMGTFKTLKEAKDFAKKLIKDAEKDKDYQQLFAKTELSTMDKFKKLPNDNKKDVSELNKEIESLKAEDERLRKKSFERYDKYTMRGINSRRNAIWRQISNKEDKVKELEMTGLSKKQVSFLKKNFRELGEMKKVDRIYGATSREYEVKLPQGKFQVDDDYMYGLKGSPRDVSIRKLSAKAKEYIKGGMADGQPTSKFPKRQMKMGVKVEMEHTKNPKIAKEIAKDHLAEHKDYYTHLKVAESKMAKGVLE